MAQSVIVSMLPDADAFIRFRGFDAVSNWTYRLQRTDSFQEFPTGIWSDVLTIPAQASTTNIVYRDAATNPARLTGSLFPHDWEKGRICLATGSGMASVSRYVTTHSQPPRQK